MKPPRPSTFTMTAAKAAFLEEEEQHQARAPASPPKSTPPPTKQPPRVCGFNGCACFIFAEQLFCSKGHAR